MGKLALDSFVRESLALPGSVIRVLQGRLRQRRRQAGAEGLVEGGDLRQDDVLGTAVRNRVMNDEVKNMTLRRQPEDLWAEERPALEVERPFGLAVDDPGGGLLLCVRRVGQIDEGHGDGVWREDQLNGFVVLAREDRPQDLVPSHDLLDRPL